MRKRTPAPIYQLKITLRGSKPPIWRRVLVSGHSTLADLHEIIQIVMDWDEAHLHEFEINKIRYSDPLVALDGAQNETRVRLKEVISREKMKFHYVYDFGDDWDHEILVEKILPPDPEKERELPVCLKGKRACPPEDVGGMGGYYYFLEAIQDPEHPEHEILSEWIKAAEYFPGEEEDENVSEEAPETPVFDPEFFDLELINEFLAKRWPRC